MALSCISKPQRLAISPRYLAVTWCLVRKKKRGPHGSGIPERPCPGGKEIGGNPGGDSTQSLPGWASTRGGCGISSSASLQFAGEIAVPFVSAERQPSVGAYS